MLNRKEYFDLFVRSMSERNKDPLCRLVLPEDLVDYMEDKLNLNNMVAWINGDFKLHIDKKALNTSCTYDIDLKRSSGRVHTYSIVVKNNTTKCVKSYHYFAEELLLTLPADTSSTHFTTSKYRYCMTMRNSDGLYVMFLTLNHNNYTTKYVSFVRYYNNETLEIVGENDTNPVALIQMEKLGFKHDFNGEMPSESFSTIERAYDYFAGIDTELYACNGIGGMMS